MRIFCLTICLFALTLAVAPAAMAQDAAAMSDSEDAQLAARAAQTPQLENFNGGQVLIVVGPLGLVLLLLLFFLILL